MKPSPVLAGMGAYPFTRLAEEKRRLLAAGVDLVDFGVGEPREETPRFIRDALAAGVPALSTYPLAEGLPETRAAIAGWVERRFGAALSRVPDLSQALRRRSGLSGMLMPVNDNASHSHV